MAGVKTGVEFQVQKDMVEMLEFAAKKYKLVTRPPQSSPNVKLIKTIW
jgi:hypothetical protein